MTRTQLQLDDDTYEALRTRAHSQRKSMSAVAGKSEGELWLGEKSGAAGLADFSFISSGASGRHDISVRHDEALGEDFR